MRTSPFSRARISLVCIGLIGFIAAVGTGPAHAVLQARRNVPPATGYITGVARSDKGPEAGVWVIAETSELPTKFAKIVVTDDQGRYRPAPGRRGVPLLVVTVQQVEAAPAQAHEVQPDRGQ